MSSPDAIYFRNLRVSPEIQYKTCSTKTEFSPSVYIEGYNGFGGRYTKESRKKIIKLGAESKMGKLGFDRFELIKLKNPSFRNPDEEIYLRIYKNGKSFLLEKGKKILHQVTK